MQTITHEQLAEIVDQLGQFNDWNADVRLDYSGRGMYGATCVGIVTSVSSFTLGVVMSSVLGTADAGELDVREDSMGRSTIVYFPGLSIDTES